MPKFPKKPLSEFPVGSIIRLKKNGQWWVIKKFFGHICQMESKDIVVRQDKEFENQKVDCYRGIDTPVLDQLIG